MFCMCYVMVFDHLFIVWNFQCKCKTTYLVRIQFNLFLIDVKCFLFITWNSTNCIPDKIL